MRICDGEVQPVRNALLDLHLERVVPASSNRDVGFGDAGELRIGPQGLLERGGSGVQVCSGEQTGKRVGHAARERGAVAGQLLGGDVVDLLRDIQAEAAAADVQDFDHHTQRKLALHSYGELVDLGDDASTVHEADRLTKVSAEAERIAGGFENAFRIRIGAAVSA